MVRWSTFARTALSGLIVASVAACSGGSSTTIPAAGTAPGAGAPFAGRMSVQSQAPADTIAKAAKVRDDRSKWTFYEPLTVADDGTFAVPAWYTQCRQLDPLFGIWYFSTADFSLPVLPQALPACTPSKSSWDPSPTINPAQVYVVRIDVGFPDGLTVGALAGPAQVSKLQTQWIFDPEVKADGFQPFNFYSFFIAQWNDPNNPPPFESP
jgi:hypothetical protein